MTIGESGARDQIASAPGRVSLLTRKTANPVRTRASEDAHSRHRQTLPRRASLASRPEPDRRPKAFAMNGIKSREPEDLVCELGDGDAEVLKAAL